MLRFQPKQVLQFRGTTASLSLFSISICFLLLALIQAEAQTWQYVYGPTAGVETGYSRVMPVKYACQLTYDPGDPNFTPYDGYIAVGTSYTRDPNGDVYVVRMKNDGTTAWEYQYDIFSNNSVDVGRSIAELSDGSGFVITGWTTNPAGDQDVIVLYIDCQGAIVWSQKVGAPEFDEVGYDIIETRTGDPFTGSYPMDLVIAGGSKKRTGGLLDWDGYLLRVSRAGILLWDRSYDHSGHADEIFYGLTESRSPIWNQPVWGDIVAVGYRIDNNKKQGYIARVSGQNGTVNAGTQQGFAHYGNASSDEVFYSVAEQLNPAENDGTVPYTGNQDVVVAGYSDFPGNKELYLVKLNGGNPCSLQREWIIGDGPGTTGKNDDIAHMIYENPVNMAGSPVAQYDLLLTGYTDVPASTSTERDVIFLSVGPFTLQPTGGISNRYGQTGDGKIEDGWSLYNVETNGYKTNGFVLCGESKSDPSGLGDPGAMYVIKTDVAGNSGTTGCERSYQTVDEYCAYPFVCISPLTNQTQWILETPTRRFLRNTDLEACTQDAEKPPVPGVGDNSRSANETPIATAVVPNVINGGNVLRLQLKSNEHVSLTLTLTNVLGEVVREEEMQMQAGSTEMTMKTDDLPKGAYFIAVRKGGQSWTQRVVIQ